MDSLCLIKINNWYVLAIIGVMAIGSLLLRLIPFLVFGDRKTPSYIIYLGKILPYSIIGMLVVYCLKDVSVTSAPFGIPELIAVVLTAVLHVWRKNTLISIICGTISYMLFINIF